MDTPPVIKEMESHGLINPVFSALQPCILIYAARSIFDLDGMLALG